MCEGEKDVPGLAETLPKVSAGDAGESSESVKESKAGDVDKKKKKKKKPRGGVVGSTAVDVELVEMHKEDEERLSALLMRAVCYLFLLACAVGVVIAYVWWQNLEVECTGPNCDINRLGCLDQFDVSKCKLLCSFGYETDANGCYVSCDCATVARAFEGDIAFDANQLPRLLTTYAAIDATGSLFGASLQASDNLWLDFVDGGRVKIYYAFDAGGVASNCKEAIRSALLRLSNGTCIDFLSLRDNSSRPHLRFVASSHCWSSVGKNVGNSITDKGQAIGIGPLCADRRSITHEVMHALGFMHEHTRWDRDSYIRVHFDNVRHDKLSYFRKRNAVFSNDDGTEYDAKSIMHFDAFMYARQPDKPVIYDRSTGKALTTNHSNDLSENDIIDINALYCPNSSASQKNWTAWGDWSRCASTCGPAGFRSRFRQCAGAPSYAECSGPPRQDANCPDLPPCPDAFAWGQWESYGACLGGCDNGFRIRNRNCSGGNKCDGSNIDMSACVPEGCDNPHSAVSWRAWGEFSTCSARCGAGAVRWRARVCKDARNSWAIGCEGTGVEVVLCNFTKSCSDG